MFRSVTTRRVGLAISAAAMVVASAAATAPAAEAAYPSSCGWGYDSLGRVSAWCNAGSGRVQAVQGCNRFGWAYVVTGPWVSAGRGVSTTGGCGAAASGTWGGFYTSG